MTLLINPITGRFDLTSGTETPSFSGDEPSITLTNTTPEDTDGGRESSIISKGLQSGSEETTLAKIEVSHDGTGDDEKGKITVYVNDGNDGDTPTERVSIEADGTTTIAGDVTATSVKATTFDTNVAAAAVTLTGTTLAADGTDTDIDINITPKGEGKTKITKANVQELQGNSIRFKSDTNLLDKFPQSLASKQYIDNRNNPVIKNGMLTHVDSDDQGDIARCVWGDGDFIYLANYEGGLHVYSVSSAGILTHIDSDDQGDLARCVWGDGDFIYLANYEGGLHVYSVSSTGILTHIDSDDQGNAARCVWGDGDFIYLANANGGLHVYTVSPAGILTHIDSDDQGDTAYGVWGDGKFIYLANGAGGLHVYSVSSAGILTWVDSDDQGENAFGVWGDGDFIYLANANGGLHVYTVSPAGILTHIDSDDQGDTAYGVWGDGNFIYLANSGGGLHAYTVSPAGILTHIDSDDQGDDAVCVWGDGNFIYLANGEGGLHTYTVDNAYSYDKENTTHTFVGDMVDLQGGQFRKITTVNAATYDLLVSDYILHVTYTATAAVTSITLMTAQTVAGRIVHIKDAGGGAGANHITIDTEASQTIDGAATAEISINYGSISLYCDGSNWFTL